jgi:hypothetical protein
MARCETHTSRRTPSRVRAPATRSKRGASSCCPIATAVTRAWGTLDRQGRRSAEAELRAISAGAPRRVYGRPFVKGEGIKLSETSLDEPEQYIEALATKVLNTKTPAGVKRVYDKLIKPLEDIPEIYDPLLDVCFDQLEGFGVTFGRARSQRAKLKRLDRLGEK